MGQVDISGTLVARDNCNTGCGVGVGGNQSVFTLGNSSCGVCSQHYESVISTAQPLQILTSGNPGDNFVDLDVLEGFTAIELLAAKTTSKMVLRIDAAPALLEGSGGTFPTGFVGGELLVLSFDGGSSFTTTFTVAAQSAQDVANEINAAAALAQIATPRATVATSGQLQLQGVLTGPQGMVTVVSGTALGTLGLTTGTTLGTGADVFVQGDFLVMFPRDTDAPARIQVSGQGGISLLAGGRTS